MRRLLSLLAAIALFASPAWAVPQQVNPPSVAGTTAGTFAAGNDNRITRLVNVDDFQAVGDGSTYDDQAFKSAADSLGVAGGTISIGAARRYHLSSGFKLADNVTIRGQLPIADQAGGAAAGNFDALGSTLLVDSASLALTVGGAGGVTTSNLLPVTSLAGVVANAWVDGPGLYRGTIINGPNSGASSLVLNINPTVSIPAGTSLTQRSTGIVLGVNSRLERLIVRKYGMAVTPFASSAAAQAEISTWSSGGTGVTMAGAGSGLVEASIYGFNQCFDITRGTRQIVNRVNIDCWNGWSVGPTGDIPHVSGVRAEPFVNLGATYSSTAFDLFRGGVGQYIYTGANDTKVFDSFYLNYQTRVWTADAQRVSLIGVDADGAGPIVDTGGNTIPTVGMLWSGAALDSVCASCQASSGTDGFVVNMSKADGSALLYGGPTIIRGKGLTNSASDFHIINGNAILISPSSHSGTPTPIIAEAGTTNLQINDPDFSGGTGNVALIDPSVVGVVGKRGGFITGYTDNLGDVIRSNAIRSSGSTFSLGNASNGGIFQLIQSTVGGIVGAFTSASSGRFFSKQGWLGFHAAYDGAGSQAFMWYAGLSTRIAKLTSFGLQQSGAAGLTATGTTQSTALTLSAANNVIATTPSGSGAILPATVPNTDTTLTQWLTVVVFNSGSNALLVYPPSGGTIDTLAANAAYSIPAGSSKKFTSVSSTATAQWLSN